MAELSLNHINKTYPNGFQAVKDFNLDIADGEFVIFVGPSGCGKSTTLRMVAGLEDISGGELKIGGTVMNDVEPKDRDIAMVFQNYALYPHMTVKENMEFPLKIAKMSKEEIEKRVAEAAKTLGLENLLDRKPKALSGGQRQRVAMGRAIVRNPKVLLMDEPLSNLDAKLRGQMRVEISKLHEKLKATTIYVTHDQTEAMTLGDRIVVMSDGEVQQIDSPQNLYDSPANKFVAGFIGAPQMNFLDAVITEKNNKVYLTVNGDDILLSDKKAKKLKTKVMLLELKLFSVSVQKIFLILQKIWLHSQNPELPVKLTFMKCSVLPQTCTLTAMETRLLPLLLQIQLPVSVIPFSLHLIITRSRSSIRTPNRTSWLTWIQKLEKSSWTNSEHPEITLKNEYSLKTIVYLPMI